MAEVPILKSSTNLISKDDEVWIQNMWRVQDRLEVRPGWGQLAQLDTTLSYLDSSESLGYKEHLGSYLLETNFGHEQIFSVFSGRARPGNYRTSENVPDSFIFIRIYDLTTNRNWEEILTVHTSRNDGIDLQEERGVYGTSWWLDDRDYRAFVDGGNDRFVFTMFGGDLFFGSSKAGMHVYHPADFRQNRSKQIESSESSAWISGYSETCLITPLQLTPGLDYKTHRYLTPGELGAPIAMEILNNRMVYAVGNTLHFSDINFPSSVKGIDFQTITSEQEIVALKRFQDALLIFTDREMFYYAPNNHELASGGRLVRVSDSVGCLSSQSIKEIENAVVWVARSGIYTTSTGLSIERISEPIQTFFSGEDLVTNPMTSYFESSSGAASPTSNDHPRTLIPFSDKDVTIAYDATKNAILFAFPELNGMWCFRDGWSWWTLESVASVTGSDVPEVKRVENLLNPCVLSGKSGFYTVLSGYHYNITDAANHRTGTSSSLSAQGANVSARSYIICQLGRGGGMDRSSAILYDLTIDNWDGTAGGPFNRKAAEDQRLFSGRYRTVQTSSSLESSSPILYARPPIVLDNGDHLIPFEYLTHHTALFAEDMEFNFWFDSLNWQASGFDAGGTDSTLDLVLPSEMAPLSAAFTTKGTFNNAGAAAVGTSAPAIKIIIDSSAVATSYSGILLSAGIPMTLFYLRLRPRNQYWLAGPWNGYGFSSGIGATGLLIGQKDGGGSFTDAWFNCWDPMFSNETKYNEATSAAQCVDWAYKSDQVDNNGAQIMARGLYADVKSQGSAELHVNDPRHGWLWGVYNVLLGSDYKGWVSQVVDYNENITKVVNKLTIRSRMMDSSGDMKTRTFNNAAKWSSAGTPANGNYLIDDQEEDEIAVSDGVRGQRLSYMVFGFIRNKAERFGLKRLTAVIKQRGRRRRRIGR